MEGSALSDLAGLRAFSGAGGRQLRDWPENLSITGSEGETGRSQDQMFLVTPQRN